jgi:hypothetical protein
LVDFGHRRVQLLTPKVLSGAWGNRPAKSQGCETHSYPTG